MDSFSLWRCLLAGSLLMLLSFGAIAQPARLPDITKKYRLVFSDDFRYPSVDSMLSPKLNKWASDFTWGSAVWDSNTECSNFGPTNVAYRREDIRLVPNPENPQDQCAALDFNYHADPLRQIPSQDSVVQGAFHRTVGLLRAKFRGDTLCPEDGFKYGIFEVRCRVPGYSGLQAAIWFWTHYGACNNIPAGWVPGDTWEIDVFETYNNNGKRTFFSTLQANPLTQHKSSSTDYFFPTDTEPATNFHTYTLVWTPNLLAWYVDGWLFKYLRNPRNTTQNTAGIPDNEMSLLLSSHYLWDCKGNNHCPTLPDGQPNDQQCPQPNDPFLIDYVRVYRPVAPNRDGTWPLVEKRKKR